MTTNLDLARVVASHVQIEAIALRAATVRSGVNPMATPDTLTLSQSHRASYKREGSSPRLEVVLDFQFVAMEEAAGASPHEAVKLDATYAIYYALPEGQEYPAESLKAFAWLNGAYNAWPYWRELVQTVTGRVGLGSISIPVYRPQVVTVQDDQLQLPEGSKQTT